MMKKKLGTDVVEAREDRFMLPGIDFKAKLIGVEPVGQPRGDQMCMDAMIKLKFLVKTSGEHKPRIIINISIEGIRLLDEKTREVLHQHEVHRISFISRDPTDLRAFGYVYGEHGNHKFYAIKTEKAADAVVLSLKDLFEVVLDLKKHQIAEQKKAEQITGQVVTKSDVKPTPSEPVHAAFKNPPPDEGVKETTSEPVYATVNKPKLTELAANLDQGPPAASGIIDLEQEVKNLQMGLDKMEEFDLNPQTPTSPGPDLFQSPNPAAAPAPASDPFQLAGPPPAQAPAPKAAALDAFGSSDPFTVQATPAAVVNSAPPPASNAPSDDLFREFKDTFTAPPQPQPQANAFGTPMMQSAPNPFGGMAAPAPAAAPFSANFGGMGGGAPAGFGGAPGGFGAPAPPQQAVDPFGGGAAFGDGVLKPESTPNQLASAPQQKYDPFSDIGALGSSKVDTQKSNKDMFANYKIGKPGEPQPAPEIKLTGGPKRPPPAIPANAQSSQLPSRHHSNSSTVTSSSVLVMSSSAPITKSRSVSSPLTLTNLPVHEDPFADDPFSRHSPSVEKTFVLHTSLDHFANAFTDKKDKIQSGPWQSSHAATNSNSDSHSGVVTNSDPFAPGGAPVTNGGSAASSDLFGSQFDTFDFSKPN